MKTILVSLLLAFSLLGFCQTRFYQTEGKKISVYGEQTRLTFTKEKAIPILLYTEQEQEMNIQESLVLSLIPSLIDLGFKITSDLIDKNLKKYTCEFSVRNTFMDTENYISSFYIKKSILLKNNSNMMEAFSISIVPIKVDENTFVFAIDKILTTYSGAKSKSGYNLNDYIIEIKVSYFDKTEKKEQTSSPITLQLLKIGDSAYTLKEGNTYLFVTDKFPVSADMKISEVSVKIVETNTAKVKAEKIKATYDNYSEDVKGEVKNIINFYNGKE